MISTTNASGVCFPRRYLKAASQYIYVFFFFSSLPLGARDRGRQPVSATRVAGTWTDRPVSATWWQRQAQAACLWHLVVETRADRPVSATWWQRQGQAACLCHPGGRHGQTAVSATWWQRQGQAACLCRARGRDRGRQACLCHVVAGQGQAACLCQPGGRDMDRQACLCHLVADTRAGSLSLPPGGRDKGRQPCFRHLVPQRQWQTACVCHPGGGDMNRQPVSATWWLRQGQTACLCHLVAETRADRPEIGSAKKGSFSQDTPTLTMSAAQGPTKIHLRQPAQTMRLH